MTVPGPVCQWWSRQTDVCRKGLHQKQTRCCAATSLSVASEGSSHTSKVLSVWVSSKTDPMVEKLVYSLLDTQSDTTFIDRDVSKSLNADKYPVKLKLKTMTRINKVFPSESVYGLRVRGYSSSIQIDLPVVYTKDCIPVNHAHIPTCDTAKHWSHLGDIADEIQPLKDCEVGGSDRIQLLQSNGSKVSHSWRRWGTLRCTDRLGMEYCGSLIIRL